MSAAIPSATLLGVDGRPVTVEVQVDTGLPSFSIVGLPDTVCRESRDRVRAALISSGREWPKHRITVNLAPSGIRKAGSGLDLPIAIGMLVATDALEAASVADTAFLGELGLDGSIRRVTGIVPLVDAMRSGTVVVPRECMGEAALVGRHEVRGATALADLLECLAGERAWPPAARGPQPPVPSHPLDLADVRGQPVARKALEVAAAGGHHLFLVGPPGAGKTMLARRLPGLLPPLGRDEALEATRIHSAAGVPLPPGGLVAQPPLRAPHHGASFVAMIGGGSGWMRPGEASLAHRGVLFLDEMGEFGPAVLDALRQPLEEGVVRICRARASISMPARFLLIGASNPCPCGEGPQGPCRCTHAARNRYLRRLSGPLLDRFDLRIIVSRPEVGELMGGPRGEPTGVVAERVAAARARAAERGFPTNAALPSPRLDELAPLAPGAGRLLEQRLRRGCGPVAAG